MDAQKNHRYLRRQPFEPCRLVLTDGTACQVRHPEMVLLSKRAVDVGLSRVTRRRPSRSASSPWRCRGFLGEEIGREIQAVD